VTRKEFHRAMVSLGVEVAKEAVDAVFSRWDHNNSGELNLAELTTILRAASTTVRGVERIRNALAKKGANSKVTHLFTQWDADGDGGISRQEFRDAVRHVGVDLPVEQIDACFDSIDREGTGAISHKLFNKILRRDREAEEAAQTARHEAERAAREAANRAAIVDLTDLKTSLADQLRGRYPRWNDRRPTTGAPAAADVDGNTMTSILALPQHTDLELPPPRRDRAQSAVERDKRHMRLRMLGTDTSPPEWLEPTLRRTQSATMHREIPRHSWRPELVPVQATNGLPKLIDVLSMPRARSHAPARRHCHVNLPPKQPKSPLKLRRSDVFPKSRSKPCLLELAWSQGVH